jgi:hypothetical protein
MRLDRDTILGLDGDEFTEAEKRYLLDKFFPKAGLAPWQQKLKRNWNDAKRWRRYLGIDSLEPSARTPYRYGHRWLLQRGTLCPPAKPGTGVTDFTGWIYSLYNPQKDTQALARGRAVERELVRRYVPTPAQSGWDLLFEGIQEAKRHSKVISALTVNGSPLKGVPDFVFREKQSGRIVIVEVKASNRDVPSDGWPNLRAQLWAYAQIDDWLRAPEVLLIGEVWGFTSDKIFLRETLRWDRNDTTFQLQNQELFDLYSGFAAKGHE